MITAWAESFVTILTNKSTAEARNTKTGVKVHNLPNPSFHISVFLQQYNWENPCPGTFVPNNTDSELQSRISTTRMPKKDVFPWNLERLFFSHALSQIFGMILQYTANHRGFLITPEDRREPQIKSLLQLSGINSEQITLCSSRRHKDCFVGGKQANILFFQNFQWKAAKFCVNKKSRFPSREPRPTYLGQCFQ